MLLFILSRWLGYFPPYGERFNLFRGRVVREDLGAEGYLVYVRLSGSEQAYDLQIELPIHIYYRLNLDTDKDVDVSLNPELIHVMPAEERGPV